MGCKEYPHIHTSIFEVVTISNLEHIFTLFLFIHLLLFIRDIMAVFRFRETASKTTQDTPISIIVCAHNELSNLDRLIPNLFNQSYPDFEVIIVLDQSTDGSREYLDTLHNPMLRIIESSNVPSHLNSKKYGLIQAIAQAKNEWLLFTDADCFPASPHWITQFSYHMDDQTDLILGISPYENANHFISKITNYETFQTAVSYASAAIRGNAYMGVGRNIAYRKSKFEAVGGFLPYEQITGGDDDLLVQKLSTPSNTKLTTHPKSLTYSKPERTWREYFNQKTRHLSVGKLYPVFTQVYLSFKVLAHAVLWLSFLYLLQSSIDPSRLIWIFGIMMVSKGVISYHAALKLGISFDWKWFLLLDLGYAVILPLIGLRASVVKNIKWK